MAELWVLRGVFGAIFLLGTIYLKPFDSAPLDAAAGAALAAATVLLEVRLRSASLRRLLGAVAGLLLGAAVAGLAAAASSAASPEPLAGPVQFFVLLLLCYLGLTIGAAKGEMLNLSAIALFRKETPATGSRKILDTSVIIDGRVADVVETGFLDGTLIIPQFVLWELQVVADSSESVRRNRGRRGLDILQRLQKVPDLDIQILDNDYPNVKEVDQKLIEMAKEIGAKIVTNDFNLNKLAQLQGVDVLNVNELANSLKPVVLPGEMMRVFVLKEGKEYNQGVAYLDDGTMVVVDNARKQISKTIEISVTSVLQTTAGKMIFGRYDEGGQAQAAAASGQGQNVTPGAPADRRRSSGTARSYSPPHVEHQVGNG